MKLHKRAFLFSPFFSSAADIFTFFRALGNNERPRAARSKNDENYAVVAKIEVDKAENEPRKDPEKETI